MPVLLSKTARRYRTGWPGVGQASFAPFCCLSTKSSK